jgi:hypothetical protein
MALNPMLKFRNISSNALLCASLFKFIIHESCKVGYGSKYGVCGDEKTFSTSTFMKTRLQN